MNNNEYWQKRSNNIFDKARREVKTRQLYADAWKDIEQELKKTYQALQGRNLTRSEIYTVTRYLQFRQRLREILGDQAVKLDENLEKALYSVYQSSAELTGERLDAPTAKPIINKKFAEACIKKKWSGEHFSSKIWRKRDDLARMIEKGVRDSIINGDSYSKFIDNITKVYGGKRKEAYRLVRTELAHTMNTAQIDTYKSEGVEYLRLGVEPGACPICLNVKSMGPIKITKLPWVIGHPNCRCEWLPVEEEEL